jgi:uncharacterized protein YabE (DUF348 family)
MQFKNSKIASPMGSRLLLWVGLALVILIIATLFLLPPVRPRITILDDGRLKIADNGAGVQEYLTACGCPVNDRDVVIEIERTPSGDSLFSIQRSRTVNIEDFGSSWTVNTSQRTVRGLVEENKDKFKLQYDDRLEPSLDTPVKDGMAVKITRVTTEDFLKNEPVSPDFKIVADEKLPRGKIKTVDKGKPGVKEVSYRNFYKNGKLTLTKKLSERVIKPPESGVKRVGSRVLVMSRSGFRGKRVLTMEATAYDAAPRQVKGLSMVL